jgi:hypothetical protein
MALEVEGRMELCPRLQEAVMARHVQELEKRWRREAERTRRIPDSPMNEGEKIYSQNNEDGILAALFARIDTSNRFFVEIGASDGTENCTRNLFDNGWRGVWIEADPVLAERALRLSLPGVTVIKAGASPSNIEDLLRRAAVPSKPDLVVIDIDGNDYWVLCALLQTFLPRMLLVEYNATFLPGQAWVQRYTFNRAWDKTFRHGASLEALTRIVRPAGYRLVGCDSNGVNAFFVHKRAASPELDPSESVAWHYTAPWFSPLPFGHPRSRDAVRPMVALPVDELARIELARPQRAGTPGSVPPGSPVFISVAVCNRSTVPLTSGPPAPVKLCVRWFNSEGRLMGPQRGRTCLPYRLNPGRDLRVTLGAQAPRAPDHYRLGVALVQEGVAWLSDLRGEGGLVSIPVEVMAG